MYNKSAQLTNWFERKRSVSAMLMCLAFAPSGHAGIAHQQSVADIIFAESVAIQVVPKSDNITRLETVKKNPAAVSVPVKKIKTDSESAKSVSRVGSVYFDDNANNRRDAGEKGIANVKVAAFSGEVVVTDENGSFEITGIDVDSAAFRKSLILKVDPSSLPECTQVKGDNPAVFNYGSYSGEQQLRSDFALRKIKPEINRDPEQIVSIGEIYFPGKAYEVDQSLSAEINAKILPYLKETDYDVKIRFSEFSQDQVVNVENKEYPAYSISQFKAQVFGDALMRRLKISPEKIEYVNAEVIEDYDKKISVEDDGSEHRLLVEVIKTPKSSVVARTCDDLIDAGQLAKIQRQNSKTGPLKATLSDGFYKNESVEVKEQMQIDKMKILLESRGGKVTVHGSDQALDESRVEDLREVLSKDVEIVTR